MQQKPSSKESVIQKIMQNHLFLSPEELEQSRLSACESIENISKNEHLTHFMNRFLVNSLAENQQKITHATPLSYAQNTLKELAIELTFQKNNISRQEVNMVSLLEGTQFTTRQAKSLYQLKPIRTKLSWQAGEYPVFRASARHYNHAVSDVKNKRRTLRRIKISSLIDPVQHQPILWETPKNIWPLTGKIYITTMQILFRINKNDSLTISFEQIRKINIYQNALEVDYFDKYGHRRDLFLIEPEELRIAEAILQAII